MTRKIGNTTVTITGSLAVTVLIFAILKAAVGYEPDDMVFESTVIVVSLVAGALAPPNQKGRYEA